MRRIRPFHPSDLDTDQRDLYDAIAGGPRAAGRQLFRLVDDSGGLQGPFNAMLLSPPLGAALQELGAAVRYRSQLDDRARELAILVVAAHWDSAFERYAHEAIALALGLAAEELADISAGRCPSSLPDDERAVVLATQALVTDGDLTDERYAAAVAAVGERRVFELTTLVGYYATLALQLRVFRVGLPDEAGP